MNNKRKMKKTKNGGPDTEARRRQGISQALGPSSTAASPLPTGRAGTKKINVTLPMGQGQTLDLVCLGLGPHHLLMVESSSNSKPVAFKSF
jgi:hypothetical protein